MPNTTVDYWDVDGTSLNEYVRNLESWGGSREAPAPLRGENLKIPYAYGTRFIPKLPDAREMGLNGWIISERAGVDNEANLKQNWRDLRRLLWRPDDQFAITRRWRDEDGVSRVATGLGQYKSGLEPVINGNSSARFAVTIEMADPFFYAPQVSQVIVGRNAYENIVEPGDYGTKKVFIDLVGPLTGITLTSISGNLGAPNLIIESTTSYPDIPTGTTVVIDVENFKATSTTGGVTTTTSGKVTHTKNPLWLKMGRIAANGQVPRVKIVSSGLGTATLRYSPAYH